MLFTNDPFSTANKYSAIDTLGVIQSYKIKVMKTFWHHLITFLVLINRDFNLKYYSPLWVSGKRETHRHQYIAHTGYLYLSMAMLKVNLVNPRIIKNIVWIWFFQDAQITMWMYFTICNFFNFSCIFNVFVIWIMC